MRPDLILAAIALVTIAGAALLLRRRVEETGQGAGLVPDAFNLYNIAEEGAAALGLAGTVDPDQAERNVRAFLLMIRHAEGTADANGYRALFGHKPSRPKLFDGWVDHPRIAVQFTDRAGRLLWTSAAGAYQAMAVSPLSDGSGKSTRLDTWDRMRRKLQLPDFSPTSQDRFAVGLIDEKGALQDVRAGRFAAAVEKVRSVWASLPGAGYDQHEQSLAWLQARYADAGGTFA